MEKDLSNFSMFLYKIRNNILYHNKLFFIFNKKDTNMCSYRILKHETTNHISAEYSLVNVALIFLF